MTRQSLTQETVAAFVARREQAQSDNLNPAERLARGLALLPRDAFERISYVRLTRRGQRPQKGQSNES